MSKTISKFIKNLDAFGQPVTLKYGGDSSFNTHIGGILTCVIQTFMFVVTLSSVIGLVRYQDPKITQFTGHDLRDQKSEEINLDDSKGDLLFGLFDESTQKVVPIDPSMLNLVFKQLAFDPEKGFFPTVVKEGEFERLTRASRP